MDTLAMLALMRERHPHWMIGRAIDLSGDWTAVHAPTGDDPHLGIIRTDSLEVLAVRLKATDPTPATVEGEDR